MNTIQTKDRLRRVFLEWPLVWSVLGLVMILAPTYNPIGVVVLSVAYALLLVMTVFAFIPSINREGIVDNIQYTYVATALGYFLMVPFLSGLHNPLLISVLVVAPPIFYVLAQYYRRFISSLLAVFFIGANAFSLVNWINEGMSYKMTFFINLAATVGAMAIVIMLNLLIPALFGSKRVDDVNVESTEGERCVTYSFIHEEGNIYTPIRRSESKGALLQGGRKQLLLNGVTEDELLAWFMSSEEMYRQPFHNKRTRELYTNEIWNVYHNFVECRLSLANGAVELKNIQYIPGKTEWELQFDVIRQRDAVLIKQVKLEKMSYPHALEERQMVIEELVKVFTLFYGGHYAKYAQEAVLYEPVTLSHRLTNYILSHTRVTRRQLMALLYLADEQSWITNKKRLLPQGVWAIEDDQLENQQLSETLSQDGLLAAAVEWDETAFTQNDYALVDGILAQYRGYTAEQLETYVHKSQYWQKAKKTQDMAITIGE